jgi:hypothetical protein
VDGYEVKKGVDRYEVKGVDGYEVKLSKLSN